MREIAELRDPFHTSFGIVAADASGGHMAVSNEPGATYVYMTGEMGEPVVADRVRVVWPSP
jgi:hypothetical protein